MGFSYGGRPCCDPYTAYEQCGRLRVPVGSWWGQANRYYCPLGVDPGEANILMRRKDLIALDNTIPHEMTIQFAGLGDRFSQKTITIKHLWPVTSETVIPAPFVSSKTDEAHEDTLYYVKLVDKRALLKKILINKAWNLRETPGGRFQVTTALSETVGKTWSQVWSELWGLVQTVLGQAGNAPTLPATARADVPEGLDYYAKTASYALRDFLTRGGMDLAYNPIEDTYSVVSVGADQDGLQQAKQNLRDGGYAIDNADPIVWEYGRNPEKVAVFHGIQTTQAYGKNPYYLNEFTYEATGQPLLPGAIAGTHCVLFDDMPAIKTGVGTITNTAQLSTRGNARVAELRQWHDARDRERWTFAGIHDSILPGSEIRSVEWREITTGRGGGTQTEYFRYVPLMDPYENMPLPKEQAWNLVEIVEITNSTPVNGYLNATVRAFDRNSGLLVSEFTAWVRDLT